GLSRRATMQALGLGRWKFDLIIGAMEPIEWAKNGTTLGNRLAYEASRGRFTPAQAAALERAHERWSESRRFTVDGAGATGDTTMSSTQHQLIEQCATRLRGIVEALDNIHDTSPHRWSTDLDDVHSSAESLLALIKDRAPTPCIDCKGTGFCNSISGEEIRCPCHAPIQFADPAQTPVEQFEQAPPSEDQLTAAGLSYPLAKEDAVKLWYAGFRSEVVTVLEAWEAIGHDIGMNPSKGELLDSLRNMAAICDAHGNDMPGQSAIAQRQVIADAITGALAFGAQASRPPPADHWLRPFYDIGRAEGQRTQELAMLVRMLASSLKRHAPESNLVARATNYLAAKGLAGTPLRDAPASVEQAGGDERKLSDLGNELHNLSCSIVHENEEWAEQIGGIARELWNWPQARAALAHAPTSSASPSCKWTESSGIWETGCGQTWSFIEDGPAENGALFCHHCGGRLVLIKSDDQEDDGEPCPECMEHGCNGECAGHGAMGD
ncbi:TPA: hypothetical protein ACQQSP_006521, partial [Pseudomonas aeruginosa]